LRYKILFDELEHIALASGYYVAYNESVREDLAQEWETEYQRSLQQYLCNVTDDARAEFVMVGKRIGKDLEVSPHTLDIMRQ
jgi:sensor histidine kinase regulating citrate/malate metabolism